MCVFIYIAPLVSLTGVSLQDILVFATGTNDEPALGFYPEPAVDFLQTHPDCALPRSSTCENVIRIPTIHLTFEQFCDRMSFGIKNSPGFGFA